jgi:hypothetical protein
MSEFKQSYILIMPNSKKAFWEFISLIEITYSFEMIKRYQEVVNNCIDGNSQI